MVASAGVGAIHLAFVLVLLDALGDAGLPIADPAATAGVEYLLAGAVLVRALPVMYNVDRRVTSPMAAVVGVLAFATGRI